MGLLRSLALRRARRAGHDVTFTASGATPEARLATTPIGPVYAMTTHPGIVVMASMLGLNLQPAEPDVGRRMKWQSYAYDGRRWSISTPGRSAGGGPRLAYWVEINDWMQNVDGSSMLRAFGTAAHRSMIIRLSMERVPETIAITLVGKGLDEIFGCDTGGHDLKVEDTTQCDGVMTLHITDHDDVPIPVSSARPSERSREALLKPIEWMKE